MLNSEVRYKCPTCGAGIAVVNDGEYHCFQCMRIWDVESLKVIFVRDKRIAEMEKQMGQNGGGDSMNHAVISGYSKRLSEIADYIRPRVEECYVIAQAEELRGSMAKAKILQNACYWENTFMKVAALIEDWIPNRAPRINRWTI